MTPKQAERIIKQCQPVLVRNTDLPYNDPFVLYPYDKDRWNICGWAEGHFGTWDRGALEIIETN